MFEIRTIFIKFACRRLASFARRVTRREAEKNCLNSDAAFALHGYTRITILFILIFRPRYIIKGRNAWFEPSLFNTYSSKWNTFVENKLLRTQTGEKKKEKRIQIKNTDSYSFTLLQMFTKDIIHSCCWYRVYSDLGAYFKVVGDVTLEKHDARE